MAERVTIARAGPTGPTRHREIDLPGGKGRLCLVVEVWGVDDPSALESTLSERIQATFVGAAGSTTARMRQALQAADAALRDARANAPGMPSLGAGASLLVLQEAEALMAQVGPALAFWSTGGETVRLPDTSPWLRRGVDVLTPDPLWSPLGLGDEVEIHWSRLQIPPGSAVLLAPTRSAESLTRPVVERLTAGPTSSFGELAESLLPADTPALRVAVSPATQTAPSRAAAAAAARVARAPRPNVDLGGIPRPEANVRGWLARAALAAARVLRGMLPERSGPDSYRVERARLAAAAVIVLPIALVALATTMRTRNPSGVEADAARETTAPAVATAPVIDGPNVARLAGISLIAGLEGSGDDPRRVVAVNGTPYVLNTALDRVDKIEDGVPVTILARGQVVGDETVAEIEDLLWSPTADGGSTGNVIALDAAGRVWAIRDGTVSAVPLSPTPQWSSVSLAAGFGGNLYVLDRASDQIVRYAPDTGSTLAYSQPGEVWLGAGEPLAEAIDMAIDGAIYVLFADGRIAKYQGGVPAGTGFDTGAAATPGGSTLFASPSAGRVLVADTAGGRIIVLSPGGRPQAQLLRPEQALAADEVARTGRFGALHDVWWDEAGGTLYAVDGNALWQSPYP